MDFCGRFYRLSSDDNLDGHRYFNPYIYPKSKGRRFDCKGSSDGVLSMTSQQQDLGKIAKQVVSQFTGKPYDAGYNLSDAMNRYCQRKKNDEQKVTLGSAGSCML
jgi:hypothetical protein